MPTLLQIYCMLFLIRIYVEKLLPKVKSLSFTVNLFKGVELRSVAGVSTLILRACYNCSKNVLYNCSYYKWIISMYEGNICPHD